MTSNNSTHKLALAITASILAACGAQGYELNLGTNLPPVDFHGFASQGFLDSSKYNYLGDTTRGSFKYTEAAINASFNPFPRTHIAAQGFLFDVGNVGEYHPALDYASVDYTFCDEFGIRAGQIRRPAGIYNSIQDIDLARTSILLPQGMYDARYRDFSGSIQGGSLYGAIDLRKAGSFTYELYGGWVSLSDDGGLARQLGDIFRTPPTQYVDVNGFPEAGLQVWWNTPVDGLRAGFSFLDALGFSYDYNVNVPPQFGGGSYRGVTYAPELQYSLEYVWKSWTFQAEYKYSDYYSNTRANGTFGPDTHSATDTWYANVDYRFTDWFQAGVYYTEDYANVANRDGAGTAVPSDAYQKDAALSFRFDPTSWWVFKIEGHYIRGTALLEDSASNPNRGGGAWYMLAVKSTFSF